MAEEPYVPEERADGPWKYLDPPLPAVAKSWVQSLPCTLLALKPAGLGDHQLIRWEHNGREAAIRGLTPFHIEYDPTKVVYRQGAPKGGS